MRRKITLQGSNNDVRMTAEKKEMEKGCGLFGSVYHGYLCGPEGIQRWSGTIVVDRNEAFVSQLPEGTVFFDDTG